MRQAAFFEQRLSLRFFTLEPSTAQRFALLALGRAWTLLGSRKNSKPEKCLKMPQNPTRQVHALLAAFMPYLTRAGL